MTSLLVWDASDFYIYATFIISKLYSVCMSYAQGSVSISTDQLVYNFVKKKYKCIHRRKGREHTIHTHYRLYTSYFSPTHNNKPVLCGFDTLLRKKKHERETVRCTDTWTWSEVTSHNMIFIDWKFETPSNFMLLLLSSENSILMLMFMWPFQMNKENIKREKFRTCDINFDLIHNTKTRYKMGRKGTKLLASCPIFAYLYVWHVIGKIFLFLINAVCSLKNNCVSSRDI